MIDLQSSCSFCSGQIAILCEPKLRIDGKTRGDAIGETKIHHATSGPGAPFHRLQPLGIQCVGDLSVRQTVSQFRNPVKEVRSTEQILGDFDRAGGSALPANFRPDDFAGRRRLQRDALNHAPQEVFRLLEASAILIPVVAQMRQDVLHLLTGTVQLVLGGAVLLVGVLCGLQLD